jgi:probable O-glycosylation ligase (exosortase A-associated)
LIRSLFLALVYVSFLCLGLAAPFVFTLGYAWVDTFRPQSVAYIILNQFPVALVMGIAALLGYFFMDRRSPPRLSLPLVLMLLMGFWVTATMVWAESPDQAWIKWDWAFKTMMFSAFIPLVIRSRVQIEAFAQTYVFSLAANFIPFGAKVLISGGGYGRNLGLIGGNSNLAEGGFLSTVCLMAIPLALHLGRHTQLLPRSRLIQLCYLGLAGFALVTALGTYERSALVGMVVLGAYMLMRSRNKLLFALCLAVIGVVVLHFMSKSWTSRIDTVNQPLTEDSALTRLLVWKWTFLYVLQHPFGGGFNLYVIDRIEFADGLVVFGRAAHSIYFEVLGEEGWIGLALYLGLAGWAFLTLRKLARRTRKVAHLAWCADMSDALQSGLAVFMTAGAFVGIAFQPAFWYFIAMSISLREYVRRIEQPQQQPGWQTRALSAAGAMAAASAAPGRSVPQVAAARPWRRSAAWGGPAR